MRKGWDDALELQNVLHHALESDEYQRYLGWFCTGQSRGTVFDADGIGHDRRMNEHEMELIVRASSRTADHPEADPMWVNSEVVDLVEYAAESFQPETVYPTDLIVPRAFCLFERGMRARDIEGREIAYRGVSWGSIDNDRRLTIALWHHVADESDYTRESATFKRRIAGSPLLMMHTTTVFWGDNRAMHDPTNQALFKHLQVLWRLAKQQVAVGQRLQVSRPVWRHKQNWRQIKTVQVFVLRRPLAPSHRGDSEDGAHYSHRFPVRGHWRNQWYPSLKDHRQIWIDPYIKGPEDAPFVAKRRAVEFIR